MKGIARWHRKAGIVTMSSRIFRWSSWSIPQVPARGRAPEGMRWVPIATLQDEALPNVMRKVIAHGLGL